MSLLLSNSLLSTVGIFILALITFFSITLFSHVLNIFNITSVQALPFILSTASKILNHSSFILLASIIISHFLSQYFLAGEPFKILSISTPNGILSTTAHIHSKSHFKKALKLLASLLFINSLCLSHIAFTIQKIAPSTKSLFLIQSKL
jgi:hypothetical protein